AVGQAVVLEIARVDSAATVRGGYSGSGRATDHRARDGEGTPEKCDGQVLRRRYHAQTQVAREAERRQETHEAGGVGRSAPGGLHGPAAGGRRPELTRAHCAGKGPAFVAKKKADKQRGQEAAVAANTPGN